jgi:hypothetical protein
MTFIELAPAPSDPPEPFTDRLRLAVAAYLARFKGPPASTPNPTCAATWPGAPSAAWTRWPPSGRTWSCTSGGCRRSAGSSPPPSPAGSQLWPGSTGPASSTASCRTHPPSMSAAQRCRRIAHPGVHPPVVRGPAHRRPGITEPLRLRAGGYARPARLADLRSHQREHRRPRRRTRPPGTARVRQGHQGGPGPAATSGRPGHRPGHRAPRPRADPAKQPRHPDGPPCGHSAAAAPRWHRRPADEGTPAYASLHFRYHDARCRRGSQGRPDRRPSRRPAHHDAFRQRERARTNLDRHPNYILAADMSSAT